MLAAVSQSETFHDVPDQQAALYRRVISGEARGGGSRRGKSSPAGGWSAWIPKFLLLELMNSWSSLTAVHVNKKIKSNKLKLCNSRKRSKEIRTVITLTIDYHVNLDQNPKVKQHEL